MDVKKVAVFGLLALTVLICVVPTQAWWGPWGGFGCGRLFPFGLFPFGLFGYPVPVPVAVPVPVTAPLCAPGPCGIGGAGLGCGGLGLGCGLGSPGIPGPC